MKEIRATQGNNDVIYCFLDNASFHNAKDFVKPLWKEVNIIPVWNLPYSPEYNSAVERYWAQLKAYFRPLLLKKLVHEQPFNHKKNYLNEALTETMRDVTRESIPAFIDGGLRALKRDADRVRDENRSEEEKKE